jgi:hypothetical protein
MRYPAMRDAPDDEPRSFQLSRGPSELWILFAAIAFGVVLIIAPAAGPWIMRAGLIVFAFLLLRYILAVRRLSLAGTWEPSSSGILRTGIALGVLGFWIWYLARGFLAGKWIDAGLASILVAETTYLEWLKRRRGPSGG